MFPQRLYAEHTLRLCGARQLQNGVIESTKSAELVAFGRRLSGLAHRQGSGEVRIRPAKCLQGVPDHLVIHNAHVGILQQFINQIGQVGPGRAIPAAG